MKKLLLVFVLLALFGLSTRSATIQWYHQQPPVDSLSNSMVLAFETGAKNQYVSAPLSVLHLLIVGSTNANQAFFTNVYTLYFTNSYLFTTNLFATNVYENFVTNNYLYSTNLFATNTYVNFFTNSWAVITNLYVTNALVLYETNQYSFVTNLFATNTYVNFFTNNYAYITNLYATNTYIEFLTNNYLFTTNLFATNVYINFLTNNYLFSTNLYTTNAYINYFTNNYSFITNLFNTNTYVEYFTNDWAWITNLWAEYAYIQFLTNQYFYSTNDLIWNLTNNYAYITNLYVPHISGLKGYIVLASPFSCDGAGCILYTNDNTKTYFGQGQFNNAADQAANYCTYFITVPEDFDNTVDWVVARFKFQLGGADTGTHRYVISLSSVADSAAYAGSLGQPINLDFGGDGAGASGDVETVSAVTLTAWKSNMTAGQLLVIRVARDGNDAADTSTVDSYGGPVVLSYGVKQ
jgi:hypothetical protein